MMLAISEEELNRVEKKNLFASGHRACGGCGQSVGIEFMACPNCGRRLSGACPRCGRALQPGWNFCPYCALNAQPKRLQKKNENAERRELPPPNVAGLVRSS